MQLVEILVVKDDEETLKLFDNTTSINKQKNVFTNSMNRKQTKSNLYYMFLKKFI